MLSFVVTKVTSDFVSRIWFYLSRVLVFFPFYGLQKFKGCIITRARIGLEIIYSSACLFGRYGGNRA